MGYLKNREIMEKKNTENVKKLDGINIRDKLREEEILRRKMVLIKNKHGK